MTDAKAAYLAGLVDGEGCFQISRIRMKNRRNTDWDWRWRYKLSLIVAMCDAPTLYSMQREFGGKIYPRSVGSMKCLSPNARQQWRWVIADAQAESCIERILPYLHNKYNEGVLALRFRETIAPRGHRPYWDAPFRQEKLAEQMKAAKRQEYMLVGGVVLSLHQAHALAQPYVAPQMTVTRA